MTVAGCLCMDDHSVDYFQSARPHIWDWVITQEPTCTHQVGLVCKLSMCTISHKTRFYVTEMESHKCILNILD